MVRELFLAVLNLSVIALPLIAALLLLRLFFRGKVPRAFFYAAWLLVLLRLTLPVSLSSPASLYNLLPQQTVRVSQGATRMVAVEDQGVTVDFPVLERPAQLNPEADAAGQAAGPAVVRRPVDIVTILSVIWGCGVLMLLLAGLAGYLLAVFRLRRSRYPVETPAAAAFSRGVPVFQSELFRTPVVCGVLRPRIVLPLEMDAGDAAVLRPVLLHERAHLSRGDNLWRLLAGLALAVHWFNPLVWTAYCAFIRDMEVSCDERVLSDAPQDRRAEYAGALLALAGGVGPLYGGLLSFGESGVKERITRIMSFKKAKLFVILLCAAAAVGLAVVFLTNPSDAGEQAPASLDFSSSPVVVDAASQPEASQPASSPASSAAQPASPAAQDYAVTRYRGEEITGVWVLDAAGVAYHPVTAAQDRDTLMYAAVARRSAEGSGQVLVKTEAGRYTLDFDPAADPGLEQICAELLERAPANVRWLVWMDPQRLTSALWTDAEGTLTVTDAARLSELAGCLQGLASDGATVYSEQVNFDTPVSLYTLELALSSGLRYRIFGYEDGLWIASSDRTTTIRYDVDEAQTDALRALAASVRRDQAEVRACAMPENWRTARYAVALYDNADRTFVQLEGEGTEHGETWLALGALLETMQPCDASELGAPLSGADLLELAMPDGGKYAYRLCANGFAVSGSGVPDGSAAAYRLSDADWRDFAAQVQTAFGPAEKGASWLGLIHASRVVSAEVGDPLTANRTAYAAGDADLAALTRALRGLRVAGAGERIAASAAMPDGALQVRMTFAHGTVYTVGLTADTLTVFSSDMSYGLRYALLSDPLPALRGFAAGVRPAA